MNNGIFPTNEDKIEQAHKEIECALMELTQNMEIRQERKLFLFNVLIDMGNILGQLSVKTNYMKTP